jgi:hypothetical protein
MAKRTMLKRAIAVWAGLLLVGLPATDAYSQVRPVAVDGCGKLARVVFAEVTSAVIYGPGKSGPWLIDLGQGDLSVCTHAAKTVSRAFTSAMMGAGLDVNWRRDSYVGVRGSGDFCLSAFLSQCYPDRILVANDISSADSLLVQKSWAVVSETVMREMYNPISSDEVRFRDNDLKLRLGLSMRSVRQHPNLQ